MQLAIDQQRLSAELEKLASFSSAPAPAVTRVMLSDEDLAAREYLANLYQDAGLKVRVDAAGNVFARWVGSEPDAPAIATGSHCDAIPYSGMYDGTVGVLGGLEAVRALQAAGYQPRRSIELIMFTAEEPTRYGISCLGSRLMAGTLSDTEAAVLVDGHGTSFGQFHSRAEGEATLADVQLTKDAYAGFVELHIEQGPLLELAGCPIGVVTHIAAPAAMRVTYDGAGGHAGAVLLPDRKDSLLPAASLALAVREIAEQQGGTDTVATTGVLDVHPSAVNSIPSRTYLEIDIRDIDLVRRDKVLSEVQATAQHLGDEHHQQTTLELINADPPATCDPDIVEIISECCDESTLSSQRMISRAYHDSLFMAQICPTAMIFIPCRDGVSHRPDEYSSPEAIAQGVEVLARSLARLSS